MAIVAPRRYVERQRRVRIITTALLGLFLLYTFLPIYEGRHGAVRQLWVMVRATVPAVHEPA
jgi:hypothetical protein